MAVLFVIFTALLVQGIQGGLLIRRNLNLHDEIVEGNPAVPGEFPSQVSLRSDSFCGASILNKYYALTAAHCVDDYALSPFYSYYPSSMWVYAGSIENKGGTAHLVGKKIKHHDFDPETLENDIAVVKVVTPFPIDGINVKPVLLPKSDDIVPDNSPAVAIGWGYTSFYDHTNISKTLNKVDLVIINQETCKRIYSREIFSPDVNDKQICAKTKEYGRHGTCKGDSGGPLFVNGTIVGIVSWSKVACAYSGYPDVYTRVSSYIDWIKANTQIQEDESIM